MRFTRAGHTVLTDLGRLTGPSYGLSVNGALDQAAASTANVLVGNRVEAPVIETLLGGFDAVLSVDALLSVTGSPVSYLTLDGQPIPMRQPVRGRAGQRLRVGPARDGLRSYVGVRGSFAAPVLLGSCAPDALLGFGVVLRDGDVAQQLLACRDVMDPVGELPLHLDVPPLGPAGALEVAVTEGPDWDEFGSSVDLLFSQEYRVDPRSNHIGIRLGGRPPQRATGGEVLSRGVPVGAIEMPSDQGLLVLHRGRGITAGYPVLAVVTLAGQDALAQARPGSGVRFRLQSIEEARVVARQRLAQREALASRVRSLLSARWDRVAENRWTEPFPPACYSRESGVNSSGSGALDAIA